MAALGSKPALVIIDMQNGFCHSEGTFSKIGFPIQNHRHIISTIQKLREQAYASNVPVFYTALEFNEDYSDSGLLLEGFPVVKEMKGFLRGSWDSKVVEELAPDPRRDVVVSKTRNSAFHGTDLAKQLRDQGVNTLFFTGVGTNVCVESSVRDAFTIDFISRTISDATATLSTEEHDASLKSLAWFGGVISSREAIETLKKT